jgi:hypothetical protein
MDRWRKERMSDPWLRVLQDATFFDFEKIDQERLIYWSQSIIISSLVSFFLIHHGLDDRLYRWRRIGHSRHIIDGKLEHQSLSTTAFRHYVVCCDTKDAFFIAFVANEGCAVHGFA